MKASAPEGGIADVAASFHAAAERGGTAVHRYRMAGAVLELRFASLALRDVLAPAFSHLEEQGSAEPDLCIHLWDSASTGAPAPPRPSVPGDQPSGAMFTFEDDGVRGAYLPGHDTLTILEAEARRGWHWTSAADAVPTWERACPMRQVLFWWLSTRGYLQVHGAAIGTPGAGALFVGNPGAGKSTLAAACLGSELLYAGDDYVAVSLEPRPAVASLYETVKLDAAHAHAALPQLVPLFRDGAPGDEKAVLDVALHFPDQAVAGFPLSAIVVVLQSPGSTRTRVTPAASTTAFAALAPTTMFQLHTGGGDELALLSRLVRSVPAYTLEPAATLHDVSASIAFLLTSLSSDA